LLKAYEQDQDKTEFHPEGLRAGSGWNCSSILILLASCQQPCMTYTIAVCTVKTPDDGQRNRPKHVKFKSNNKFEKLVHLVGFIIRNLHDAVSHERQQKLYGLSVMELLFILRVK
jgi:hypothetical protein